jgi:Amylo-alpha-1,6-glucosidase
MMTRREAIKTGALAGIALAALPRALAQSASSASPPMASGAGDSMAQLAAQIRADSTLSDVRRMAQGLLKGNLNAGGNYDEVWIRDTNTFIEVALEVNPPRRFREAFLNFFKFQGDNGDIVDGYRRRDPKGANSARLSPLAPDFMAFKNSVETDQEPSLVQAIFKYVNFTNDKTILEEVVSGVSVRDRLGRALNYVLTERFDHKHGLVWGGTRADWGDVQPEDSPGVLLDAKSHRALTIYDSAMLVVALNNYLQLIGEDSSGARHWTRVRDQLKRNARKHLWDTKNRKFIPHLYLDGSPFPKDFNESAIYYHGGTAVAIEAGLLTRDEVAGAFQRMEANVRAASASSIGLTMYPPYPNGFFKNPQLTKPYTYQNGGDWCWFGGRMTRQLAEYGFVAEAYRSILPMAARVVRVGDFHEWWSLDNQPRGSGGFRGSAGVLGKAVEMLQAWAAQHQ